MPIDVEIYKRIHKAIVPKDESFDLIKVTEILMDYLSTILSVSASTFENKVSIWKHEDFSRIIDERKHCQNKLFGLHRQIDQQINCALSSIEALLQRKKKKEEENKQTKLSKLLPEEV